MHLLFDYGGVLVQLNKARCIARFEQLGFDIRPYLGTYAQRGIFSRLERGKVSVAEFCNELRRLAQRPDLTDESLIAAWQSYLDGVPAERMAMILRLRRHYPVHLLSNTNAVHWQMACTDYFCHDGRSVTDYFDHVFLSYKIGYEKPAPEIYAAVVAGIGCAAHDILFLDDSETNCEAARQCGLQARLAPADGSWLQFFTPDGRLLP